MAVSKVFLNHSYLESLKRVIGKQSRPGSDATYVVSDQAVHCLLSGFSIKDSIKATKLMRHPKNDKWTSPTYNSGRVDHYKMDYKRDFTVNKKNYKILVLSAFFLG